MYTHSSVAPENMEVTGRDEDWLELDVDYTLTCKVDLVKPAASIYWRIDGSLDNSHDTQVTDLPHGAYSLSSERTVKFTAISQETAEMACLITELDDSGKVLDDTESKEFFLHCEFLYCHLTLN